VAVNGYGVIGKRVADAVALQDDMELIGIPHRVVVGERGLKQGKLEYQGRCDQASTPVAMDELIDFVKARLCAR